MRISRILHPTDFTAAAGPAFDRAVVLAKRFDAELHVLHVTETFGTDPIRGAFDVRLDEDAFYRELWVKADQEMKDLADRVKEQEITIRRVHSRGQKPAPVILEYARDQQVDLIVMGTHGRRGFRRMVTGSVAMEVVRKAAMPVMTVGPRAPTDAGSYFGRILVPVDFSKHARTALRLARDLAFDLQSELVALHVVEKPNLPAFYEASIEMIYGSMHNMEEEARQELKRLNEELDDRSIPTRYEIRTGHAADEILKMERSERYALIVLSTHGTTGLPRFFLGSVSERVIRSADAAVLRIRTVEVQGSDQIVDESAATK